MLMTFFSLHTALYLSLSFLFLILNKLFSPIMMSFCRKSVYSLLGLSSTAVTDRRDDHHDDRRVINPRAICSQGLISLVCASTDTAAGGDDSRCPTVLESTAARLSPAKKDPGGIGFIDDIGGGVNGLMSCTESLGFESSDERRVDDDDELSLAGDNGGVSKLSEKWSSRRRRTAAAGERKRFPPPLSSLNRNGQPSFFLRPVRKDGRLELTEVRINRPEILRAYREDGRLRLHLIRDEDENEDESCIEEEPEDQPEENNNNNNNDDQEKKQTEEKNEIAGGGGEEWKFPVSSSGGGEGFRRCQEKAVWRQHCVSHQARRLHVAV